MHRIAGVFFVFLIFSLASAAAQSPQYRRPAPAQEECPQGRQIRAQKAYPSTMTDCEVLDADTASLNQPKRPPVRALTTASPQGPSYDCSKATNSVERLICNDKQLAELEWLVAGAFKKAMDNQTDKTSLIAQQRQFNIARNDCAKEAQSEVHSCVQQLLGSRAMYLSTLWKKDPASPSAVDSVANVSAPERPPIAQPTAFTDTLKPSTDGSKLAEGLVLLAALLTVYFFPTLMAYGRGHHNRGAIAALNLFLGWSFLGWVAAFVWACTRTEAREPVSHGEVLVARPEPRI